jgi:hypothetical protein
VHYCKSMVSFQGHCGVEKNPILRRKLDGTAGETRCSALVSEMKPIFYFLCSTALHSLESVVPIYSKTIFLSLEITFASDYGRGRKRLSRQGPFTREFSGRTMVRGKL